MTRTAFIDESQRPGRYFLAAMAVEHAVVDDVRRTLRTLAPKGVVRRHFVKESDQVRNQLLAAYRSLPGKMVSVYVIEGTASTVDQRAQALELMVKHLLGAGVSRVVLDHVDDVQQRRDRQLLARQLQGRDVTYAHEVPHTTETGLWVPDGVAWCAGRAGWRSKIADWVTIMRA